MNKKRRITTVKEWKQKTAQQDIFHVQRSNRSELWIRTD